MKPPVPLKLEEKVKQPPPPVRKEQEEEKKDQGSSEAALEFNQLANLIGIAAAEVSGKPALDDFKFTLFP